jgi:hypothetical protein
MRQIRTSLTTNSLNDEFAFCNRAKFLSICLSLTCSIRKQLTIFSQTGLTNATNMNQVRLKFVEFLNNIYYRITILVAKNRFPVLGEASQARVNTTEMTPADIVIMITSVFMTKKAAILQTNDQWEQDMIVLTAISPFFHHMRNVKS